MKIDATDSGKKEKEQHGQKKKITPGMAATANRLETSNAVLSALKEVGRGDGTSRASIYTVSEAALSLLKVIQDSEEDVDEDLVNLVLDTCGLVYIIIDACSIRATIPDLGPLTETIDAFRIFCMKKIHGSLYRKIKKRGDDEKVMHTYQHRLFEWLAHFEGSSITSIHDSLEALISRKLRPHINEPRPDVQKPTPISLSASYAQKPVPPMPQFPIPAVQIQFPSPSTSSPMSAGPTPVQPLPGSVSMPSSPNPLISSNPMESASDPRAKRRLADELRRKEERERWRRSEEMYNALPPASPEDSTPQTGSLLDAVTAHIQKVQTQSAILPQPQPHSHKPMSMPTATTMSQGNTTSPARSRPTSLTPPRAHVAESVPPTVAEEEDPETARLKQIKEDRITAYLLAGEMQLEIEKAEREEARAKRKASKRQREKEKERAKGGDTNQSSPTQKHRPPALIEKDSGYLSDNAPIPVRVESPAVPASPLLTPPFRTTSLSRSSSLTGAGPRPASPKMPRPRRSPSPLHHEALFPTSSPKTNLFPSSSFSNELRPPMSMSSSSALNSRDRDRELDAPSPSPGLRRSSDAVRPLPSPLQQRFSAEDVNDGSRSEIYLSNVSKSGISFGSGSVHVRNLGN